MAEKYFTDAQGREWLHVNVRGDVRINFSKLMTIPRDVWEDKDSAEDWGEAAEKYVAEDLTLDHNASIDFDDSDVGIDDMEPANG